MLHYFNPTVKFLLVEFCALSSVSGYSSIAELNMIMRAISSLVYIHLSSSLFSVFVFYPVELGHFFMIIYNLLR